MNKEIIEQRLRNLQDNICQSLEQLDGEGKFQEDLWERPGGGGGRTRIIQGKVIEKGGVNFSAVHGKLSEPIRKKLKIESDDFFATGVSIVLHPHNPFIPIIHMNVRYFELNEDKWWFGGGIDLTPHYINTKEAAFFHNQLKNTCDKYHKDFYTRFKKWADDYFFIRHRNETRGIGGIFFDRLGPETGLTKEQLANFIIEVGETFIPTYVPLAKRNLSTTFNDQNKQWQGLRRGRYVEFNLVWDAGTKFGLETNGRIESILMSLPSQASWTYDYQAAPDSEEEKTLQLLKKEIDWLGYI